jgi:hypothetical protein
MPVIVRNVPSRDHRVALEVAQSGMTVTTSAGSFYMNEELTLAEGVDAALTADTTYDTVVVGYLARHRGSGDIVVAVDEIVQDGDDVSCAWVDYDPFHPLFALRVPPAASSLDDVQIDVYHLVAQASRPKVRAPEPASEPQERPLRGGE